MSPAGSVVRAMPRTSLVVAALSFALASLPAGAQTSERSGKQVVDASCITCHGTGVNGAPRIGDKNAWSKLEARGLTALEQSALKGIREMPSHGGNPGFSDVEIGRAITFMVNQSGGHWAEPVSRSTRDPDRTGAQVVSARCADCHATGKGGAPKIHDQAAWIPRVKPGLDGVVRSAIRGHGAMPARGGVAELTDAEVRNAIVFMMGPAPAK
jgi:cytochrome c5